MCLQAQGIDDDYGGAVRVRRACGIRKDDGGVGRGQGICDASKGLDTTTEAEGARKRPQVIYDDDVGIRGGR